jgi:short subunit dehydrogenase-like uncharacterized protein
MTQATWLIYGANGYTGTIIAEEALRRGHRPVLAGRSAEKLRPLAERLGLEMLAVDLRDADALARALEPHALVVHAAGPFVDTSAPMVQACLATRTNYIDVTGEIVVFQHTLAQHAAAEQREILLLSGAGFDVVPTDCLALHVAQQLPNATTLEIGIAGMTHASPGTTKSMLDGAVNGGLARRDGVLVPQPVGKDARWLRFADRERRVLAIPWGDLETAYRTTGIPNITTYSAFPRALVDIAALSWPLTAFFTPLLKPFLSQESVRQNLQRAVEARVQGPTEAQRKAGRSQVWASASDAEGHSVEAWLETLEGYDFTAVAAVRCVEHTLAKKPVGALTPALAFGKDFVLEIEGTTRHDDAPDYPVGH